MMCAEVGHSSGKAKDGAAGWVPTAAVIDGFTTNSTLLDCKDQGDTGGLGEIVKCGTVLDDGMSRPEDDIHEAEWGIDLIIFSLGGFTWAAQEECSEAGNIGGS